MRQRDLHSALKTEVVGQAEGAGVHFTLVRLQYGKEDIAYSLHGDPRSFSTAGLQTSDVLAHLGFRRGACAFTRSECYAREAEGGLDAAKFAADFGRCYEALRAAERHLDACGVFLDQPEGWGVFFGKPSSGRSRGYVSGDGHTAAKVERMKESEDDSFSFVFSWLEGGSQKGWTTHYRPKHPPLSPEVEATFDFLSLKGFAQCPEFDFEPCHWRMLGYEQRGDSIFDGNADFAHRSFDAHAEHFSPGIEKLLEARLAMKPYGMGIWPDVAKWERTGRSSEREALDRLMDSTKRAMAPRASTPTSTKRIASKTYTYDVAISFAGPERPLAEQLAEQVRAAGFEVFYDDFYPEQLWGKDLVEVFDSVYRKDSRYCVMFISRDYAERMWTTHERRSAQARALEEKGKEYILPIRVDETDLDGMPPTRGHLDLKQYDVDRIGELLIKKLRAK